MKSGRTSLASRVAMASAVAAALGGVVASLTAGITAEELVDKHEAKTIRKATAKLVEEVSEERDEDDGIDEHGSLQNLLDHELAELKLFGAEAAIHRAGERLAGATDIEPLKPGTCRHVRGAATYRLCTQRMGPELLTLRAPADAERDRSTLLLRALLVGLLGGALIGGLASYVFARWALRPLSLLRDRVRRLSVESPNPEPLAAGFSQIEVEELRGSVHSLVRELSQALTQAQRFSAEAAHELRTPLTTIAGELELLEENAHAEAPALARVRRQVSDLTSLVQRLLILASPGRLESVHAEVVELADVAEAVREALPVAQRARLAIEVKDDASVHGDGTLLRAMLGNAVENALKFSRDSVRVEVARDGEWVTLSVHDEGPGVAEAERARVFEPFYRSAQVRAGAVQGHGLGLALIARVARIHGGEARFVPAARGATLAVRLPAWRPTR